MTVPYRNSGKMRNTGWEFHTNTNRLIKAGPVTIDINANFGNNRNEILEMDEYLLNSLNSTFGYNNGEWLRRVQLNNPQGAIYGFKYKGVYQYNYDTFKNMTPDERAAFLAAGKTAPVAFNADGNLTTVRARTISSLVVMPFMKMSTTMEISMPSISYILAVHCQNSWVVSVSPSHTRNGVLQHSSLTA